MNEVVVTIAGNVAGEIKHRITATGVSVTSFRLASTPRRRDGSGNWSDRPTSFFTVTCWRGLADNVAASLAKGQPVLVSGKLSIDTWERAERSGLEAAVIADAVGHDLSRGCATFRKIGRGTRSAPLDEPMTADDAASEETTVAAEVRGSGSAALLAVREGVDQLVGPDALAKAG